MNWLIDTLYYIVPFIVLLGILVFVHEFGHFIVARLCGVRVSAFSIGFGKKLCSKTDKHGTEWRLCAIPLGGYCQFLGDDDAASSNDKSAELSEDERQYAFATQNPYKKLAIVIAGPAANYLFAILIFASIFFFWGKMEFPAVVGEIIKGGAAETGGVMVGDKIVKVNDKNIKDFNELRQEVDMHNSGDIKLSVERDGKIINLSFPLKTVPLETELNQPTSPKPMLGIRSVNTMELKTVDISLWQSLVDAVNETYRITALTLRGVGQMIVGTRGTEEIGGIVRIAEMTGDISKYSGFLDFVAFMALLSINLGLINLFPIPLLDGGHVIIFLSEIVIGHEINEKAKEYIFRFGLFILISLMLFATYNDFAHLFNRWFS